MLKTVSEEEKERKKRESPKMLLTPGLMWMYIKEEEEENKWGHLPPFLSGPNKNEYTHSQTGAAKKS